MKHFKRISTFILSLFILSAAPVSTASAENDGGDARRYIGYYLEDCMDAVGFNSWEDYLTYSQEANKTVKGDDYIENYDYIYVPSVLSDKTEGISCIYIAPEYCKTTYVINDQTFDTFYYYSDDNKDSNYYMKFAEEFGSRIDKDGITYYKYSGKYFCKYDDRYFSFGASLDIGDMGSEPFTKVYFDPHLLEEDGALYYTDGNGEKQTGWKTVNGHEYYFRESDGTAVTGRAAMIGGYVYKFNDNGICKGRYTGYAVRADGTRAYYQDGVIA